MKLSKTQIEALKAVRSEKVREITPFSVSKSPYICGASKVTIKALIKRGLVEKESASRRYYEPVFFRLTEAGVAALAEVEE